MPTVGGRRTVSAVAVGLLAAVLLVVFPPASGSSAPAPPELVFVLAGQSNMLGRGFPLSSGDPSDPNLSVWRPQQEDWAVATDPLGNPGKPDDGIGPGMTFGRAIAAAKGETVGLIQCAAGGVALSAWAFGSKLYNECLDQVRASHAQPVALLFLQGESEARGHGAALNWDRRFLKLAPHFEQDFGPGLLVGQIGTLSGPKYKYQAIVRTGQAEAASTLGLPLVVTSDLPVQPDGLHFTVDSYKTIGLRFAAAWLGS